ncbi:MAG TPA: hypothetical protein VEY09_14395 [Pyrinomonadaceae bacterium]|nr:hypothetical protein [Pyrinomonadaceae bacterium]
MRRTLTTAALVLALTCPTFAGIMHTPVAAPPPPPPPSEEGSVTNAEPETGATDGLTEAALSLLRSVLALL